MRPPVQRDFAPMLVSLSAEDTLKKPNETTLMARYHNKLSPSDPLAARSWVGKFVRDTIKSELGLVHDVVETDAGLRLLARFPGESVSRHIALEPTSDMLYLLPGDVHARYRPPTEADQERVKALVGSARAA